MSSIHDCSSVLGDYREEQKRQTDIIKAVSQYDDRCDSEQEQETKGVKDQEQLYQGFENKRSLKIKPVNMFKDVITLRKQNMDKKQQVKKLQSMNDQLRKEYDECINQNTKLQHFLKEVEFTFQPQRKKTQASQVLLRARQTLFQQAREAKDRLKRMFRNNQASAIQQLKLYISTLQGQKQNLKSMIQKRQQEVAKKMSEEDFNSAQVKKYQLVCQKVKNSLTKQVTKVRARNEDYKIQKMQIKGALKIRLLENGKRSMKGQANLVKNLLMESEGLQYEIGLLRHRNKDRKKQTQQYEQLQEKIRMKEGTIARLQKQLRQKNKTFDYMLQWTKQLKKQLEERKSDHARKKALFEEQINSLSQRYQKYNQIYKAGLFEEQVARRRGPREPELPNYNRPHPMGRQVTLQEIKMTVKSLSFCLLQKKMDTQKFIESLLKISDSGNSFYQKQTQKQKKKLKIKSTLSIDNFSPSRDIISLQQLIQNLQSARQLQNSREEVTKIARYIVEDGSGKAEEQTGIAIGVARQILRTLLQRDIESLGQTKQITAGLKKLFQSHSDALRQELKVAGGRQEEIQVETLKRIFLKYAVDPYHSNLFAEFFQFYSWLKRSDLGYAKLQDYDEISHQLTKGDNQIFKKTFSGLIVLESASVQR